MDEDEAELRYRRILCGWRLRILMSSVLGTVNRGVIKQFAKTIDDSETTLAHILGGNIFISRRLMHKLKAITGITMDWLECGDTIGLSAYRIGDLDYWERRLVEKGFLPPPGTTYHAMSGIGLSPTPIGCDLLSQEDLAIAKSVLANLKELG